VDTHNNTGPSWTVFTPRGGRALADAEQQCLLRNRSAIGLLFEKGVKGFVMDVGGGPQTRVTLLAPHTKTSMRAVYCLLLIRLVFIPVSAYEACLAVCSWPCVVDCVAILLHVPCVCVLLLHPSIFSCVCISLQCLCISHNNPDNPKN
jgi:hypothetical protein